jgi:acetoacetate decarboxylase
MQIADILNLPSIPAMSPSYPRGPYRFVGREYLVIYYNSDPDLIRAFLPEPLEPLEVPVVRCEWSRMPDSSGFGSYTRAGIAIPCRFGGEEANFLAQMYVDAGPPIAAGREIWGYPQKYARPTLAIVEDTLTGTLVYGQEKVALGTMAYKHSSMADDSAGVRSALQRLQVTLKVIPGVDGLPAIAQLVGYRFTELSVHGSWRGAGRLALTPHANAPLADLPVRAVTGAQHFLADMTLPYGRVLVDYLKD